MIQANIMHTLERLFTDRIVTGLTRSSIDKPSKWAEKYRIIKGKRWVWRRHPWLKGMHDSTAELNVGKKSAQMGYTETVLNLTFYNIDILGNDCLYALPNKTPDASDFSASRFDPALEESSHLRNLFSDVKNVGHKRAGAANLFIRGSQSRAGFKSVPVSFISLDEVEEFKQENIPLVFERASGQESKNIWMISTPMLEDDGIDAYYKGTSQEHFFFACPACTRKIELTFPDCMVITSDDPDSPDLLDTFLKCPKCDAKLPHELKPDYLENGIWVPQNKETVQRGFHVNQLYSSTVKPHEIAKLYLESQSDAAAEQEFYNSKLGKCHTVKGARLSEEQINAAKSSQRNSYPPPAGIITFGVDVGTYFHVEIDQWQVPKNFVQNEDARCRVIRQTKVKEITELEQLVREYRPLAIVIDANPERRTALEFANRWHGIVKLCFYARGLHGKTISVPQDSGIDGFEHMITVDRTAWLDLALGRFKNTSI